VSSYLLLTFLHVVGFAYWLGGDLGVFHSSYYVANPANPREVRVAAAKILFWLDQVPRICMTLMLPTGLQLAWQAGLLGFGASVMTLIWSAAFAWLGMVVYLHAGRPSSTKALLTRVDFWFRLTLSIALLATGSSVVANGAFGLPSWVGAKIGIFGALVGLGLIIRIKLKPFGPAFANIAAGEGTAADDAAIEQSLGGTRPFVVAIWIGLLTSAALGIHLI
jgi:hypothetical protein